MQPLAEALSRLRHRQRRIVVPYLMVDRGRRAGLASLVRSLAHGGASALELGFPFSDPIADGPTLEAAADRALSNGTEWSDLLRQISSASAILPTAVMTYANPVLRRGLAEGMAALRRAGASGLIVPDLSLEESGPWSRAAHAARLSLALLAAPSASPGRVGEIARRSKGFLYLVSRFGTTGRSRPGASSELGPLVRAAHKASPRLPVLVGFGVRDKASAAQALSSGADGVIVGSALEVRLQRGDSPVTLSRWLAGLARPGPRA